MKGIKKALMISALASMALVLMPSVSFAIVIGERVEFSPTTIRAGETITMTVHFRVEGEPADLFVTYTARIIPSTAPPPPTIVGTPTRYNPGSHAVRLSYRIPDPLPTKICFDIPAVGIKDACLETAMIVASKGTYSTVGAPVRPQAAGAGMPDLTVRIRSRQDIVNLFLVQIKGSIRINVRVSNIGTLRADDIPVHLQFQGAGGNWVTFGLAKVKALNPGETVENLSFSAPEGMPKPIRGSRTRVVVDPDNRIAESNEDNNIANY